jgi:DNA-binding MarR family transcriptional regulator
MNAAATTTGPDRTNEELSTLIARCRRLLWFSAHHELVGLGESMWSWQILAHIDRCSPITQCDLAYATAQHPAAISRLLSELEEQGLVKRQRDQNDRRRMLVVLTRKGRHRHSRLSSHVFRGMARPLAAITTREQNLLRQLLGKLADNSGTSADCK